MNCSFLRIWWPLKRAADIYGKVLPLLTNPIYVKDKLNALQRWETLFPSFLFDAFKSVVTRPLLMTNSEMVFS